MAAKIIKRIDWKASLIQMNVGETLTIPFSDETCARVIASRLKKQGYKFTVSKDTANCVATCLLCPENKQEA